MNAEQQKRLHELALIMLRDAHGEDFTAEEDALLPAQIEEYQRLTEPQEILSLLGALGLAHKAEEAYRADKIRLAHEVDRLRAQVDQLQLDKARLDSGCIITDDRDEFGESYRTERRGMDLRTRIDEAMAKRAEDLANG